MALCTGIGLGSTTQLGRAQREAHVEKICVIASKKDQLPRNGWCLPMHHFTQGNAKNVLSKPSKRVAYGITSRRRPSMVRKVCHHDTDPNALFTFVQFRIISRNTKLIHSLYVICTILQSTVFLYAVEDCRQDGEVATSQHFIRSPRSATGQTKTVPHHHSFPTSAKQHRHYFLTCSTLRLLGAWAKNLPDVWEVRLHNVC